MKYLALIALLFVGCGGREVEPTTPKSQWVLPCENDSLKVWICRYSKVRMVTIHARWIDHIGIPIPTSEMYSSKREADSALCAALQAQLDSVCKEKP